MRHFVTSNFNLMHSNNEWKDIKENQNITVDSNFNYYFFSIKDKNYLRKYNCFHIFLYLDKTNLIETYKKILFLKREFEQNSNKLFFFYLIFDISTNHSRNNKHFKKFNKLFSKLEKTLTLNTRLNIINNLEKKIFNLRNKKILSFPFEIDIISIFKRNITKNLFLNIKPYKLIILDCDNTLWGGVVDEIGIHGIDYGKKGVGKFFREFQNYLMALKKKGFLLSLSSKNNSEKVWKAMKKRKMVLSKKDFILPKINWEEKYQNIILTIKELNLRAADIVFIDDNLIEVKKVKKFIKNINVIHIKNPGEIRKKLKDDLRFQKNKVLNEDKKKFFQYKIKTKFDKEKQKKGISLNFFKSLKQKAQLINLNDKNLNRALQIFNKTNQFNFSLNRYTSQKLREITSNKDYRLMLFNLKDKFGDHGIVSSCIFRIEKDNLFITDFAVSCRVISRYVEDYMIYLIIKKNKDFKYFIKFKKTNLNNNLIPIFLKKNFFKLNKKSKKEEVYEIFKSKELMNVKKIF